MKSLLRLIIFALLLSAPGRLFAQSQTVTNGQNTTPITFSPLCNYTWTNSDPSIGLPASGNGNIPAFTAKNLGTTPIVATITATPNVAFQGYAYAANQQTNKVTVINTADHSIAGTIPVGIGPTYISTSEVTKKVYVSNFGTNSITVINGITNTKITDITVGTAPMGSAIGPDGKFVYVANTVSNTVSVIDAGSNTKVKDIPVGVYPYGVVFSPDGSRVYVTNGGSSSISVIDPATNTAAPQVMVGGIHPYDMVISPDGKTLYVGTQYGLYSIDAISLLITGNIPVSGTLGVTVSPDGSKVYATANGAAYKANTQGPYSVMNIGLNSGAVEGLCISPDGKEVYVSNYELKEVTVINVTSNTVTAHIPNGTPVTTFGHFFLSGSACTGSPITYTITVNPTPNIATGPVSGNIITCQGTPSADPNIQKFTITGSGLSGNVTAIAPNDFEISLTPGGTYFNTITLPLSNGSVASTIYVRAAATAHAANITGQVTVNSIAGALNIGVSALIRPLPSANQVADQTVSAGTATTTLSFTGNADNYTWSNNDPTIGLAANGTGNIPSFVPVNNGTGSKTAIITVTPALIGSVCAGAPMTFKIIVRSAFEPAIYATGNISPMNTIYGTASAANGFRVSGVNLTSPITITPPAGFEVSIDNITYGPTAIAPNNVTTTVYIRLAKNTAANTYNGPIRISSAGVADAIINVPNSTVSPAPLTITIQNVVKTYGAALPPDPASTNFTPNGLKNGETIGTVSIDHTVAAAANAPAVRYPGAAQGTGTGGGTFNPANYIISYNNGDVTVNKASLNIKADDQKRYYGANNPPLTLTYTGFVNNETHAQLTTQPVVSTTAIKTSDPGPYPIYVSGATSPNYDIRYIVGTLTIDPLPPTVSAPSAFTPNGDGINDVWVIASLSAYPNNTVNIYDRNGAMVFQSKGYDKPWDGTYNGSMVPTGTYYYIIDLKNSTPALSGSVTIIR